MVIFVRKDGLYRYRDGKDKLERVTRLAIELAKEIGLDPDEITQIEIAGLLHDIGKVGTYETILDKPTGSRNCRYRSRILAVADTFDAMCANRPYRKGKPVNEVIAELKRFSGSQFDVCRKGPLESPAQAGVDKAIETVQHGGLTGPVPRL